MLSIDNNVMEGLIVCSPVGRIICLGSERGGKSAATIYSTIETTKLNCRKPFWYLANLLAWLPVTESTA